MTIPVPELVEQIRETYRDNPEAACERIERILEGHLRELPITGKDKKMQEIISSFQRSSRCSVADDGPEKDALRQFVSLLLGQPVDAGEMDDQALQIQLCTSLNTIFDSLNQLLKAMRLTFNRDGNQFEETIRHVLKDELVQENPEGSLEEYIDQIRESFFKSFESAQISHKAIIEKLLVEINPEKIEDESGGGLRLGPLKKAEAFDRFINIYEELSNWHESGRGHEEFLRTFEKYFSTQHR